MQPITSESSVYDTYTGLSFWSLYTVSGHDLAGIYFLEICKGKYLIFDATWHSPSQNMTKQAHPATRNPTASKPEDNLCHCDSA